MSEPDKYELDAEGMLTGFPDSWSPSALAIVQAVAARLRSDGAEIERLRKINEQWHKQLLEQATIVVDANTECNQMRAEIERLRTLDKTMAKAHNSNLVEMANMREEIAILKMGVASLNTAQPGAEQNYYFMLQGAKQEMERLKSYAKNYTGFEAQPCPFCTWDNGKFIAECGFHREIALLKAKIDHYIKESFENLAEAEKCGMEKAITEIENDGELGFSNRVRLIEAIRAAMPKAEGER